MPGTEFVVPAAHSRIGPQRGRLRSCDATFEAVADATSPPIATRGSRPLAGRCPVLADAWQEHVEFTEGAGRPVRGAASSESGRGGARGRPAAAATTRCSSAPWPGPGSSWRRRGRRSRRRPSSLQALTGIVQAGRPAPAPGRRPALPGLQRRLSPLATERGLRSAQPPSAARPSAKLSGCGSSGASRSSTCAASRG